MSFIADSLLVKSFEPSPNFGPRRNGYHAADMVVLHYTGMDRAEGALDWLTRPESSVSAHYLVTEAGEIIQMVLEEKRAWHAGVSFWAGEEDINSCSIGIEIQNPGMELGYPDFPAAQIDAVTALCMDICSRLKIVPERVLAHSDVAPERKPDPGEKFPWDRLHEKGIGLWVTPVEISDEGLGPKGLGPKGLGPKGLGPKGLGPKGLGPKGLGPNDEGEQVFGLQTGLKQLGYRIEVSGQYCKLTEQVVTAFQRHWRRGRVDGRADRSTIETLDRLLGELSHSMVG